MEIRDILDAVDIVEVVSEFVDLEEKGGEFWGISPFTYPPENTPSFSVRRETGSFFDFSSGIGGNAITFLQHYHKTTKAKAVDMLKRIAGISDTEYKPRQKMAATAVCKRFIKPKTTQKKPITTVLSDDYMERYEWKADKMEVWRKEGISDESMHRFQVFYDSYSNRLVYPIRNLAGKIVNIGGRTLDPDWKAKGQRKYCYFYPWGTMDTIYGLAENMEEIKKKGEVIIFEGCKSVLIADTWGIKNTAAILTSHVNPAQMKILAKLGCRVVFALDKEVNVREDHNITKLKQYVTVEYLWDKENLLDAKDAPVDKGGDVFGKLYNDRCRYR